jgi:hypothetical protein
MVVLTRFMAHGLSQEEENLIKMRSLAVPIAFQLSKRFILGNLRVL